MGRVGYIWEDRMHKGSSGYTGVEYGTHEYSRVYNGIYGQDRVYMGTQGIHGQHMVYMVMYGYNSTIEYTWKE